MLSKCLFTIALCAFMLGGLCYGIRWLVKVETTRLQILSYAFIMLSVISAMGAVIEKGTAVKSSSLSYYYEMLEQKTFIEEQIIVLEEEIEALHSGNVDGVVFKSKKEIIKLNNAIKRYNFIILRHQEYKDNYWHKERCNEGITNLNTFEEIF